MSGSRKLPPPRGAEDTRSAILGRRFNHDESTDAGDAVSEPPKLPAGPSTKPAPAKPAGSPSSSSTRTPAGMTRRTYYVPLATAAALDDAATQVVRATGGLITKHQALSALLNAGVDQAEQVAKDIRAQLLSNLGPPANS